MKENVKMPLGAMELDLDALKDVSGGVTLTVEPTPTGSVTYKCPACGQTIHASSRDMTVTCPNIRCQCRFQVKNDTLVFISSSL